MNTDFLLEDTIPKPFEFKASFKFEPERVSLTIDENLGHLYKVLCKLRLSEELKDSIYNQVVEVI